MSLNALEIYLTKSRKIIVPGNGKQPSSSAAVATFNRNLISLGFVCSQELTGALAGLSEEALGSLYQAGRPDSQVDDRRSPDLQAVVPELPEAGHGGFGLGVVPERHDPLLDGCRP